MAFAISAGRLAQVQQQSIVPASMATGVRLSERLFMEYAEIWRRQPQVRTVVSFLARNTAQLGLHVYRRVSDTDRERVTDHPLAELLGRPNPRTTPYRFKEALVSDMAIYDNAFIAKVRYRDQPRALVRVDPRRVTIVGDSPFEASGYEVSGPRGKITIPADQMIHFRGYSPLDERAGTSPMETLRGILAEEWQAQQYRQQLWRNGARTAGYLRRPLEAPEWTQQAKERFRAAWQAQYAGDGAQAGGTPILEDGMEWLPAATTPRDAQYIESRKLTREEVTAAYHIPLTLVGILEHATYSNITEQHKMLYQDTLGPWLAMIQEELMLQLLPDFPGSDDLYVEFNLAEKLRGSFEEQAAQLQAAVGAPYMTRNEARARLNLPQLEDADELITPLNVLEGSPDEEPEQIEDPDPSVEEPEDSPQPGRARLRAVEGD